MKKVIEITYAKNHAELEREYATVDEAVEAVRNAWKPLKVTTNVAVNEDDVSIVEDAWITTGVGSRELQLVYWGCGAERWEAAVIEVSEED